MAQDRDDEIRARAHAIWEEQGKPHGHDALHWDQATRELNGNAVPEDSAEEEADAAISVVESAKAATARKVRGTPKPATTKTPKAPG